MVPYTFRDVVRHLPYVAVVPGKYMFVHGGLSPQFVKKCSGKAGRFGACLDEATAISVTWADPHEGRGWVQSPRGRGVYKFGVDIAKAFLDSNNLHAIWRGHEQMEEGSSNITFDDHYVFTIFSSADYVGVFCLQGRRPLAAPPWDRRMFAGPGQNNAGALATPSHTGGGGAAPKNSLLKLKKLVRHQRLSGHHFAAKHKLGNYSIKQELARIQSQLVGAWLGSFAYSLLGVGLLRVGVGLFGLGSDKGGFEVGEGGFRTGLGST